VEQGQAENAERREQRRRRAWQLKQQGWRQHDIAVTFGVNESSVSRWMDRAQENNGDGLLHHEPSGRPSRLTDAQLAQVPDLLAQGPEAFGFQAKRWTARLITELIHRQFGIEYNSKHVANIARQTGWLPHRWTRKPREHPVVPPGTGRIRESLQDSCST
jgi:transposase